MVRCTSNLLINSLPYSDLQLRFAGPWGLDYLNKSEKWNWTFVGAAITGSQSSESCNFDNLRYYNMLHAKPSALLAFCVSSSDVDPQCFQVPRLVAHPHSWRACLRQWPRESLSWVLGYLHHFPYWHCEVNPVEWDSVSCFMAMGSQICCQERNKLGLEFSLNWCSFWKAYFGINYSDSKYQNRYW